MDGNSLIRLEGVTKVYEGASPVRALQNVSLEIKRGEFVCVAGPSGSGKTTLLNLLGLLDRPTQGEIFVFGKRVRNLSRREAARLRRESIGFVFQSFNLIPVLTAFENVEYVLWLRGFSAEKRHRLAMKALEEVGLSAKKDHRPEELSGGEQQRVAVARAVAGRPPLVLADEPTANLDSETGANLIRLLRNLNRKHGLTFVFSSHDPRIIELADRVIRLRDGRMV